MDLALQFLGILVFFFLKYVIYKPEPAGALIKNLLGIPVDVALIGFMLSLVTISQNSAPDHTIPYSILFSVFLVALSIYCSKRAAELIEENSVGVSIPHSRAFWALALLSALSGLGSVLNPIVILGASA
ncbi:MAG: hypothetical protein RIE24_16610 [Silicimonas sp.]